MNDIFKALNCEKLTSDNLCSKDADISRFIPCFVIEKRGHISGSSIVNKCFDFKGK